ncbi:nitroreductase family deazaflavin-dependent oxidoreductase [Nocardia amamiensis]|uniref:nitroreductase family deazaflavin-dependent oxidoreductase n=1 Tax=Nocardia amamiensis TaxID=404578 RepID=UPI00340672ED
MKGRPHGVLLFWRAFKPGASALAMINPIWVMLETTGRHSTQPRRIPLARGPMDGTVMSLISVHGTHADRVRNVQVDPRVRLRSWRRWHTATATVLTPAELHRFNINGRLGPKLFAMDGVAPVLVRIDMATT